MYTVTFYSFKGGVGRSMALVNVAAQLAMAGKRVLLVDFDLEAPGLPTFNVCRSASDSSLGLVDYVTEYVRTGVSPSVRDYVYKSHSFEKGGELWVMPVGRQDSTYSHRLNSINWSHLYGYQNGFLMFEDLKKQWEEVIDPDYVLIDSRTGHSDVEGICTRQLPDAVSLLFFPNEQNLAGLSRVTSNIRAYLDKTSRRDIALHFAVSNVPDLDDEDHILSATLTRFKDRLGFDELAAEIHHYNSLSLLDQEIFSISRPGSKLAKEYRRLTQAITRHNLEDRDAVVDLLSRAQSDFSVLASSSDPDTLRHKIETIFKNFPRDGEINFLIALVYDQMGNAGDALSLLLSPPVDQHYRTAHMLAVRARLQDRIGARDAAIDDLRDMLQSGSAEFESFLDGLSHMEQLAPTLFAELAGSIALRSLSLHEQLFVASQCDDGDLQLAAKIAILRDIKERACSEGEELKNSINHYLAMAFIALRDFVAAVSLLEQNVNSPKARISDVFNFAMAKWGLEGCPSIELFRRVAELDVAGDRDQFDPNYAQCLGLTNALVGDGEKARKYLDYARVTMNARPRREFSSWSYRKEMPEEFVRHLSEIERILSGDAPRPKFLALSASRAS